MAHGERAWQRPDARREASEAGLFRSAEGRRKTPGGEPKAALTVREKWLALQKPQRSAISDADSREFVRSAMPSLRRRRRISSRSGCPKWRAAFVSIVRTDTPSASAIWTMRRDSARCSRA